MRIDLIFMTDCPKCDLARATIKTVIAESDTPIAFEEYNGDTDEKAIDLAIEHSIDDLPAIIINDGSHVFQGKAFSKRLIKKALL